MKKLIDFIGSKKDFLKNKLSKRTNELPKPIWVIGPPRARTKWVVNSFDGVPGYRVYEHPEWVRKSPYTWRYNHECSMEFKGIIQDCLNAGISPVIMRHEIAFAKDWVATQWPNSKFLVVKREIFEWLTSVHHYKGGLFFLYGDREAPPEYVGRELPLTWWNEAEWWKRAIAHYWAFLGASIERIDKYDSLFIDTNNNMNIEEVVGLLRGTWAEKSIPKIRLFKPSSLRSSSDFSEKDVQAVLSELNSMGPWKI